MGYQTNQNMRQVQINFDLYSGTEDVDFKLELIMLMIANVNELVEAATEASEYKNLEVFNKAVHKSKSTVSLLNDAEFTESVCAFRNHLEEHKETPDVLLKSFHELCASIIQSLEQEARLLKAQL